MMYGAPRPPIELPPTSGLRDHIARFAPHPGGLHLGGGPVDQPVPGPPVPGPGPFNGFGPGGPVGIAHPMQQGNQQAMLGAMRGYLQ